MPIDQGEELFRAEGLAEGQAFLKLLRGLLGADDPQLIALFTIRSDAYEPLQSAPELEGLKQEMINLPPMPKGSYAEVITGPALRCSSLRPSSAPLTYTSSDAIRATPRGAGTAPCRSGRSTAARSDAHSECPIDAGSLKLERQLALVSVATVESSKLPALSQEPAARSKR